MSACGCSGRESDDYGLIHSRLPISTISILVKEDGCTGKDDSHFTNMVNTGQMLLLVALLSSAALSLLETPSVGGRAYRRDPSLSCNHMSS